MESPKNVLSRKQQRRLARGERKADIRSPVVSYSSGRAPRPVYLSYTLRGFEDGCPFVKTLQELDRWTAQAADTIEVVLSVNQLDVPPDSGSVELASPDKMSGGSGFAAGANITAVVPESMSITLRQNARVFIGGQIWDTSFIMACWALGIATAGVVDWGGVRICEVGAGIGMLGLVLAALDARVTVTDMAEVVPILRDNISRNPGIAGLAGDDLSAAKIMAAPLDWRDPSAMPPGHPFDLVFACDCIYSEVSATDLVHCLVNLCRETPARTTVYVVSEVRNESIQETFYEAAQELFDIRFKCLESDVHPFIQPSLRTGNVRFYELKLKLQK